MDREETFKVALAALLHDLGKFWQRTGRKGTHFNASAAFVDEFQHLFPHDWLDDIRDGAGNHHATARKEIERIVRVADWLASGEPEKEPDMPQSDPDKTPLLPVAARVEFREETLRNWQQWGYRLEALSLEEAGLFPTAGVQVSSEDYQRLWARFDTELRQLGQIDNYFGFISFLALLRKYASFIPSATPGRWTRSIVPCRTSPFMTT